MQVVATKLILLRRRVDEPNDYIYTCAARTAVKPRASAFTARHTSGGDLIPTDLSFYAAAVPAVLLMAINKSGFGSGVGVMAVPLMALTIPPLQAAAILLPILCIIDVFSVWAYRKTWDRPNLRILLPGSIVGIVVGTLTAGLFSSAAIRFVLGVICVVFSLNHWLGRHTGAKVATPNVVTGGFWGAVGGFTSFLAHAGGPAVNIYLLPQKLDQALFVGTTVIFFAFVNFVKLLPYAWLGQFSTSNLAASAALAPFVPLGVWLGIAMNRRISPLWFYRIAYALVFFVGLKLLWDGFGH